MLNATTQCVGPDAAVGGAMSCNPLNGVDQSATITYEDAEAYGMDSISIPVTIAKNTDGIDATSVSFQEASLTPQLSAPKYLGKGGNPTSEAIVGTFFFHRVDNKCGKILVINNKGKTTDILTPNLSQDCLFTLQFKESLIGEIVALVATDSEEIVDDIQASAPIFLKINPPHPLIPHYTFNVFITGVDSDVWNASNITFSDESVHAMVDIQDRGMAFLNIDKDDGELPKSEVVFSVIEDNGQTALWSLPAIGGYPEPFIDTSVLSQSMISSPYELHFFDAEQIFYQVNGLGDITEIDLQTTLKRPIFKIHPSGEYILYNASRLNPYTGENSIIPVIYFVDKDEHMDVILEDQDIDFAILDFDWMNQYTIILVGKDTSNDYHLIRANLEEILDGYDSDVTDWKEINRSITYMGNPTARNELIYYHCEDAETGINNICEVNINTDSSRTLIDVGMNLSQFFLLSNDELSYIAFQTTTNQAEGSLAPVIGMFDLEDEETYFITIGHAPLPSNFNLDIVAYRYRLAPDEPNQVGVLNLSNDLIKNPDVLNVFPTGIYVGQGSNTAIRGVDGRPPYKFQLKSGIGHINEFTGSYRAPMSPGTAIVSVTDQEKNTADGTIYVAAHGQPDPDFKNNNGTAFLNIKGQAQAGKMVNGGSFIIAGTTLTNDFFISKFNSSGNLMGNFGEETGYTTTSIGDNGQLTGMIYLPTTGQTIISGWAEIDNGGDITEDAFLARYNADGTLDETFRGIGVYAHDIGLKNNRLMAMAQQGNNIVGVGYIQLDADQALTISRYSTEGVLDTTFGNDGLRVLNFTPGALEEARAVAIQTDKKIVVGGFDFVAGRKRLILARYSEDGNLDFSFGLNGKVITGVPHHSAIIDDIEIYDNKIYICGTATHTTAGTKRFLIARYLPNGTLDTTFGINGFVIKDPIAGGNAEAVSLDFMSSGKMIVAGFSITNDGGIKTYRVIQQYKANGQLNYQFGTNGTVIFEVGDTVNEGVNNISILSDDRILYTGWIYSESLDAEVPAVGRIWY